MKGEVHSSTHSDRMRKVGQKNTRPEILVRQVLHAMGHRFRLHRKDLPGVPDIVLPRLQTVVFVHGCFWHQHPGCPRARRPKTRVAYWNAKLDGNIKRDRRNIDELERLGWNVVVIWECQTIKVPNEVETYLEATLRSCNGR